MKRHVHLHEISRSPRQAQAGATLLFDTITQIIDRLLLAQRQAPWKATGAGDAETDSGTGTTDNTNI